MKGSVPYTIGQVIVLSLEFQKDRHNVQLGQLLALGVPFYHIKFLDGVFYKDFKSGAEAKEAAKSDGFAFFRDNWAKSDDDGEWYSICIAWGICRMLREISRGPISLMILSDMLLQCPFPALDRCVHDIVDKRVFHALQLLKIPDGGQFDSSWSGFQRRCDLEVVDGFQVNSDYATVVSPDGANRLLDEISQQPWSGFAKLFELLSVPDDKSGFFSTVEPVVVELAHDMVSQTVDRSKN